MRKRRAMMRHVLELSHIGHCVKDREGKSLRILQDVSLCVSPGQVVTLVGANGAGKSTLALMASGFIKLQEGCISVDGKPISASLADGQADLVEIHRGIGIVFQNPAMQIVASTVFDEVAFGPRNLGLPLSEVYSRVEESLRLCGIEDLAKRDPLTLSGGQAQALVIAGTVAMHPHYVILDEPCSMLDAASAVQIRCLIERLRDLGCGVLVVSHDARDILESDRACVLHVGRLVYDGSPEELLFGSDVAKWGIRLGRSLCEDLGREYVPASRPVRPADAAKTRPAENGKTRLNHMLKVEDAEFAYPGTQGHSSALSGVTASFEPGRIYAIAGANGSGKSTLLKLLAGLIIPQKGSVSLDAKPCKAGDVAYLMQDPARQLFADSVADDVAFALKCRGLPAGEAKPLADAALIQAGLDPRIFGARSPFALSGSEARRAALAGVLTVDSDFLLLDEPTAGLDGGEWERLANLLLTLANDGKCVIVASHDVDFVCDVCDEAIVLEGGQVIWRGDAAHVTDAPGPCILRDGGR